MRTRINWFLAVAISAVLAACVTIHVHFPEAAAERAADRFIQDVIGQTGNNPQVDDQAGDNPAAAAPSSGSGIGSFLSGLLIAPAYAQQPDIDIDTPQITAIRDRMAERHREQLAAWLDAGAIGLTRDGLIGIRDRGAVGLAERRNLEQVVNADNSDRNAVYREIAVANGRPEWEPEIRETFARRWISNARSGWYYQDDAGNWVQK